MNFSLWSSKKKTVKEYQKIVHEDDLDEILRKQDKITDKQLNNMPRIVVSVYGSKGRHIRTNTYVNMTIERKKLESFDNDMLDVVDNNRVKK